VFSIIIIGIILTIQVGVVMQPRVNISDDFHKL